MTNHLREDRIQDYADDLLCAEERAEVEQHLLICADCQFEVAMIRDLVTGLHALDHEVQPDRDLLAGINERINPQIDARLDARIDHDAKGAVPFRQRSLWSMRAPLAAAALVLIAISALITSQLTRSNGSGADTQVARGNTRGNARDSGGASANTHLTAQKYETAVDERYLSATDELEHQLAVQRPHLAPETVQLVEENLRVINAALAETRGLLRSDPDNVVLTDLMRSAYEKKLDLLRNATQTRGTS